jgi:hypothetical protein
VQLWLLQPARRQERVLQRELVRQRVLLQVQLLVRVLLLEREWLALPLLAA